MKSMPQLCIPVLRRQCTPEPPALVEAYAASGEQRKRACGEVRGAAALGV